MTDTPSRPPPPYPSFEDPPPRALCVDALLGRVVRRMFEDASRSEDGLDGALKAVLAMLDQRTITASKPSR